MSDTHNVLSLDVGGRRIGVALASLEARLPSPLLTIDRSKVQDVFGHITSLIQEYAAETVVIGLPRGMDGQETAQTASAREFARQLEAACNAAIVLQDEAATSLLAEDELKESGKPYEKADIDKLAATYILRDWLTGQKEHSL